jgi:two-component system CheB/CheR fusion protein
MANQAFYRAFGVEPEATLKQLVYDLGHGQWNKPGLRVLLEEVLPHDRDFLNHEVVYDFPGIGWKSFMLSGRYMVQEPDTPPLILLSLTDITERKKIEAALIQAEKLAIATRLAASIAHEINNPLAAITNLLYLASDGSDAETAKAYAVSGARRGRPRGPHHAADAEVLPAIHSSLFCADLRDSGFTAGALQREIAGQ